MTTLQQVIQCIQDVIKNKGAVPPPLVDTMTALDASLDFDSLDYAELVVRLQSALAVDPFATSGTFEIKTVGDLAAVYEKALAARAR